MLCFKNRSMPVQHFPAVGLSLISQLPPRPSKLPETTGKACLGGIFRLPSHPEVDHWKDLGKSQVD